MSILDRFTLPKSPSISLRRTTVTGGVAIAVAVLLAGMVSTPAFATTQTAPVALRSAAPFSVLAGAAATIPGSTLPGQVGAAAAITADAGTVYGSTRHAVNDPATATALSDLGKVYTSLAGLPVTGQLTGDDLGGQTVTPGVYHRVAAYAMTTPVTFDAKGDPTANFILQSDAALNTTAGTTMNLINGAQASHIFWVTRGAATLGASSRFFGTILSYAAVTVGATSTVCGRALSVTAAVTLDADVFSCAPSADEVLPTIAITSGTTSTTATPTISGTSTAPAGSPVAVTIGSGVENTTVGTNGTWSVTSAAQTASQVAVSATVTDPGGYTATATQVVTIAVKSPPVATTISITGAPQQVSKTHTPTISGTTNAPVGSPVTVTVGSRIFTTKVTTGGVWALTTSSLANGTFAVVASVPAGCGCTTATATETLTVAVVPLTITITGGSKQSTTCGSLTISGTTNAAAGSVVTVLLDGKSTIRTTSVTSKGTWSITITGLANGQHAIVASVKDSSGNSSNGS